MFLKEIRVSLVELKDYQNLLPIAAQKGFPCVNGVPDMTKIEMWYESFDYENDEYVIYWEEKQC